MKACWVFGIAMAAGFGVQAEACNVTVSVHSGVPMPSAVLMRARLTLAAMFREIGVEVRWRAGAVRATAADDACSVPIVVQLENTPLNAPVPPDALAYAAPFAVSGTSIHVLLDRVRQGRDEILAAAVLAHVLAHEITHVLEQIDRHSAHGVMKGHWDRRDYKRMELHSLPFASEDVELIHRGMANRMLHAAAQ